LHASYFSDEVFRETELNKRMDNSVFAGSRQARAMVSQVVYICTIYYHRLWIVTFELWNERFKRCIERFLAVVAAVT
jgi:hypothetical protein